jgi:hypothetical protein
MGAPTSSYATASIALRVSGALKPHHHNKVETSSVGTIGPSVAGKPIGFTSHLNLPIKETYIF